MIGDRSASAALHDRLKHPEIIDMNAGTAYFRLSLFEKGKRIDEHMKLG
jgi:hypothetical protein